MSEQNGKESRKPREGIPAEMKPLPPPDPVLAGDQGLPRSTRVRTRREFGRAFHKSKRGYTKNLTIMLAQHGSAWRKAARVGVVVSTKVSKSAVRRHQLKRWVREAFRLRIKARIFGNDLVVTLKTDPGPDHVAFDQELDRAIERAWNAVVEVRR
jgi:ribonuclease P protein component